MRPARSVAKNTAEVQENLRGEERKLMGNDKQEFVPRLFESSQVEYEAIVHVYNRANPDTPGSAVSWRHWDQHRDPVKLFTRYVLERQGEIGGYGFSTRTDPANNKFRFAIHLLPQWTTTTIIDQFYSYIMSHCLDLAPAALLCQTRENETEKIAWMKQHGFAVAMRYPFSILDLSEFDPASYTDLKAHIATQGIEIISLTELATRDPGWQRNIYELEMLLSQDVPMPTTFAAPPFEQYVKREFEDPGFLPEAWMVVLDGDVYAGMANLFRTSDDIEVLETGLTGVLRDYRRRGLATALKSRVLEVAKGLGARKIFTSNEEDNPMFQLNLRLGFKPQPADLDWEKAL
jgi:GNAT superfamily N-acetyltransferase